METSLRQRLLSAAVLIPTVILAVLALPTVGFASALMLLAAGGAWEWAGVSGWPSPRARLGYALALTLTLALALGLLHSGAGSAWGALILAGAGGLWWCIALAWVVRYQRLGEPRALASPLVRAVAGWLVLAPTWGALVALHGAGASGPRWVMFLLVLVWLADSGAYFAGRRWGERRLAARVSPGKTWEGALGGLAAVAALAGVAGLVSGQPGGTLWPFVGLCVGTAMASVLGDLTESMFKRRAGLKDSGRLIPGHGGVLDRIDSLCAAAPVFVLGMYWLEIVT